MPMTDSPREFIQAVIDWDSDECTPAWPFSFGAGGYPQAHLDGRCRVVHRWLSLRLHGEPPTNSHQSAHFCGNRTCLNPRHLRWATPKENNEDSVRHGTRVRGERSPLARLTAEAVVEIRQALSVGEYQAVVAERFGVTRSAIGHIAQRRTWRHLP